MMSSNENDDVFAVHSRRHSSADLRRNDLISFHKYRTPQAPVRRKTFDVIMKDLENAPIKKQKSRTRRASMPQLSTEGLNAICKRLDFGEEVVSRKRMHPFMSALHYNDVAIPFSELELACPRTAKRVRFSDETISSPIPETPTYESGFRVTKKTQSTNSESFTKITGPLGMQVNAKNLFQGSFSSPCSSKDIPMTKTPARNLNLFLQ